MNWHNFELSMNVWLRTLKLEIVVLHNRDSFVWLNGNQDVMGSKQNKVFSSMMLTIEFDYLKRRLFSQNERDTCSYLICFGYNWLWFVVGYLHIPTTYIVVVVFYIAGMLMVRYHCSINIKVTNCFFGTQILKLGARSPRLMFPSLHHMESYIMLTSQERQLAPQCCGKKVWCGPRFLRNFGHHFILGFARIAGINETGNYMPNGQPLSVWHLGWNREWGDLHPIEINDLSGLVGDHHLIISFILEEQSVLFWSYFVKYVWWLTVEVKSNVVWWREFHVTKKVSFRLSIHQGWRTYSK